MEKISPETLEEKPAQSAFKPLYILMAVLIIFTPLGLLASGTAWGEWGVEEMASLVSNGKALGYTPAGMEKGFSLASLFPDYSMARNAGVDRIYFICSCWCSDYCYLL